MVLLCSSVLPTALFSEPETGEFVVGVNMSRPLKFSSIVRASVGNTKVAKATLINPQEVLVTGVRPGKTSLFLWSSQGNYRTVDIHVIPSEIYHTGRSRASTARVVRVEVEFLEMDISLGKSLGIRWPEALQFSGAGTLQGGSNLSGLNYSVVFSSARGWLSHLVQHGRAKIIASPELYVRSGEEATFHSGGELPIPTTSENYGRYHKHVEWKPYGITVKVRPQTGDNVHLSSDIKVEISELNTSQSVSDIPSIVRRSLETKMDSIDGEAVILSGLVRQASSEHKESLPLLGSIPLIGSLLFSKELSRTEQSDVLISITFSIGTRTATQDSLERHRSKILGGTTL